MHASRWCMPEMRELMNDGRGTLGAGSDVSLAFGVD